MFHKKCFTFTFVLTIIAGLALYTNATQAQILTKGLISYWSFDNADIKGETVKDILGKNDGTIVGKLNQVEGKFNDALGFTGEKGNYVKLPRLHGFDKNFSIGYWFKTPTPTGIEMFIFSAASPHGTFGTAFHPKLAGLVLVQNKGLESFIVAKTAVSASTWSHVLVSWGDGSGKLYLNGEEVGDYSEGKNFDSAGEASFHAIGAVAPPDERFPFNGVIDEFYIYDRPLSKDEAQQVMTASQAVEVAGKLSITWGEIKEKAR